MMKFRKAAQEGEVRLPPIDNVVIIIAARDGAAHHQKQHLAQRIHDLPGLPPIHHPAKVIKQGGKARPRRKG
jgi:hypothetical protein